MQGLDLLHNRHLESLDSFQKNDPQLAQFYSKHYQHHPQILNELPQNIPGIYTIGGGRQIGKSTLMKLWMLKLLQKGINPKSIYFISGELIFDHIQLVKEIQRLNTLLQADPLRYLIIDEITYIQSWDKGIKYAADAGLLAETELFLTSSDLILMQEARMTFPGRRGKADKTDFHYHPLSFYETVTLKNIIPNLSTALHNIELISKDQFNLLAHSFDQYLLHGGYLTAINDMAESETIAKATFQTYSDWIRGDVLKRGKHEHTLKEILSAIIAKLGSQVSWNALSDDLSVQHPQTVIDYISLLTSMDAVTVQQALMEHKLCGAPKKAKKVYFLDPFILHAMNYWLHDQHPTVTSITKNKIFSAQLVELTVVSHFKRFYPTYYIKNKAEIDIAYIHNKRIYPVEIKWTNQLRPKELTEILKYSNSEIWSARSDVDKIQGIPSVPLVLALLKLASPSITNLRS
jgi:predicted AAA+ superfamily ATPase